MKPVSPIGCIPVGTIVSRDDFFINPEEQEKEMKTEVFEYCIVGYDEDIDNSTITVGPEVIVIEGEENRRDNALLKIGQRHAGIITEDSEILIRPFC